MSSTDFFQNYFFQKNAFMDTIRMSNDFYPDMGPKLFENVISKRQRPSQASKELTKIRMLG